MQKTRNRNEIKHRRIIATDPNGFHHLEYQREEQEDIICVFTEIQKKYAHKIYALYIMMAGAIIVLSFTDVQMGTQKGFLFVSFSTAISHRKKEKQLKRNKRLEENKLKCSSLLQVLQSSLHISKQLVKYHDFFLQSNLFISLWSLLQEQNHMTLLCN